MSFKTAIKQTLRDFLADSHHRIRRRRELFVSEKQKFFYRPLLNAPGVVFDVGANAGNRTKIFRALGRVVLAVEPLLDCAGRLREMFRGDDDVHIITAALGAKPELGEIAKPELSTIASMSPEWIAVVSESRFADYTWAHKLFVPVLTLDLLCEKFGRPCFVKIDVEGYELEVLRGLTIPVPALCFEFTPEFFDFSSACVERIQALGDYQWNVSLGESFEWLFPEWKNSDDILSYLRSVSGDKVLFGDVYARLKP